MVVVYDSDVFGCGKCDRGYYLVVSGGAKSWDITDRERPARTEDSFPESR